MLVTDKQYYMDKAFLGKLDLMIKRMSGSGTDDNVLPIDGDEGQGKTEMAVGMCYYVSYQTGRPYSVDNIFFDIDEAIKFATRTKDQIVHIDEGALGLLRTQWWNKTQQKFIQLVMVARKKRHFIIICIPKFHRLPQYLIEERAIGLVHVYSRKNLQKGRFCYYTKSAKDTLFQDWERKKIKNYKKYYVLRGSFVKAMEKVFVQKELDEYERKKDEAILSIIKEKEKPKISIKEFEKIERETKKRLYLEARKKVPEYKLRDWSKIFDTTERTLQNFSTEEKKERKLRNQEITTPPTTSRLILYKRKLNQKVNTPQEVLLTN